MLAKNVSGDAVQQKQRSAWIASKFRSYGKGIQSPVATARCGSVIHSLQEPAYNLPRG